MSIKAKFFCSNVVPYAEGKQAQLSAVTSGSEENKSFSKYTPSGQLSINISNETEASNFFEVGKEYYLTFDEVSVQAVADAPDAPAGE